MPESLDAPDADLMGTAATAARTVLGLDVAPHPISATPGRLVARAGTVAVKVYRDGEWLRKEVDATRLAAAVGVPVAEELRFDPGPPAILVTRWIDGEPVGRHPGLAQEAGRLLRPFHDGAAAPAGMADTWVRSVGQRSQAELRRAVEMGVVPEAERRAVAARLTRLAELIEGRPQARIHGDLQPDHVLVDPRAGTVVAVLDFANAGFADPLFEVAGLAMLDPALEEPFVRGLGIAADEQLLEGYRQLRLLMAATWYVERGLAARAAPVLAVLRA